MNPPARINTMTPVAIAMTVIPVRARCLKTFRTAK
jgi:hypothetical protein